MIRSLYAAILRLHPRRFRELYGQEILAIFDQAAEEGRGLPLLADGVASLFRQWLLRSEEPGAQREAVDVPVFYFTHDSLPPPGRLLTGAILSGLVFFGACMGIKYGSNPRPHPGSGESREAAGETKTISGRLDKPKTARGDITDTSRGEYWALRTTSSGKGRHVSPSDALTVSQFGRNYVRLIRVLNALDTDRDGILSAGEISRAAIVLKTLDADHDGILSPEECGFRGSPPGIGFLTGGSEAAAEQRRRFLARVRPGFMRFHPVLAALDANHDGLISASEIEKAPAALWSLDKNGDGRITEEEYLPDPVTNELLLIMSRLDANGDGMISPAERTNSFATGIKDVLAAAQDRNGIVNERELRNEIRRRADLNRDGAVTWSEMLQAMQSGAFGPVGGKE
jgi:Ca2+-binding EF-hand superfamily protein